MHTRSGEVQVVNSIVTDVGTRLVTEVPVDEGEHVTLLIDMVWRRSMMRNHTSEHLFISELKRLREDIELGYRLRRTGHRIRLCPDIQVTHLKKWTLGSVIYTDIFLFVHLEKWRFHSRCSFQNTQHC